jgi:hypothetical protein
MIQEQKCAYVVMMKFWGFGTFGHATSSLVVVFSWKIFKMNLQFWRFSIIVSDKIIFSKWHYTGFYNVAKFIKR